MLISQCFANTNSEHKQTNRTHSHRKKRTSNVHKKVQQSHKQTQKMKQITDVKNTYTQAPHPTLGPHPPLLGRQYIPLKIKLYIIFYSKAVKKLAKQRKI